MREGESERSECKEMKKILSKKRQKKRAIKENGKKRASERERMSGNQFVLKRTQSDQFELDR